jgi:hypothetical protein
MPRGNRAAGEQAVKGPEAPRAPEREIPRPSAGAGVGARPKPIVLDGFALFLLGDPRDLPEESKRAKELLGIDIDEVEREGARAEGGR